MATVAAPRTPPGPPRPRNPVRRVLPAKRDRLAAMTALRDRYGPAVRFPVGPLWFYLFSDPDLVQEVLVGSAEDMALGRMHGAVGRITGDGLFSSTGDLHRRQRRIVQPAFHRSSIRTYVDHIDARTEAMLDTWEHAGRVDIVRETTALAMHVVTDTILGGERIEDSDAMYEWMGAGVEWLDSMLTPLGPALAKLPNRRNRAFDRASDGLRSTFERMIALRRAEGREGPDALWALLSATDEDGAPLPDDLIRDELITMVLAGQETTAIALSWTLRLLADHPEAEERIAAEARAATLDDGALDALTWTRRCVEEGMRLYPPAWVVSRIAARDTTIGGWEVPKGVNVFASPWVTHRDPELWPDPERFAPEQVSSRHKFAYFPFGGGARKCIGSTLAVWEATIALALIARRVRLRPEGPPPPPVAQLTLRPGGPIWMSVASR